MGDERRIIERNVNFLLEFIYKKSFSHPPQSLSPAQPACTPPPIPTPPPPPPLQGKGEQGDATERLAGNVADMS